jgi:hypothetical protein
MKVPVGLAYVTPYTGAFQVGRFSGDLINGQLLLTVSTLNPSVMAGLAFGVFSLVDDDNNVRALGDVRYYPKAEPTTIALGYGNLESISGVVIFEPRAYNLRWLKREASGGVWGLAVEAETLTGSSSPAYTPAGFALDALQLATQQFTAPDGGKFAQVVWFE